MATQKMDSAMVKVLGQKYWNHFAIQLGHWNPMKVVIMSEETFSNMSWPVKIELAREMGKYLNEEVMYCQDAENASVWILGPKKVLAPSVLVINSIPIWDPKKKHARVPAKIPRPPNAYILYRRDKHNQVKAEHPGLHNNEISVITGAMWKGESPEVRALYHQKAEELKQQLLDNHPEYRYSPRKPSEIRRRARRAQSSQNTSLKSNLKNMQAAFSPISEITRQIPQASKFLPPFANASWTPYHLLSGSDGPSITEEQNATSAEGTAVMQDDLGQNATSIQELGYAQDVALTQHNAHFPATTVTVTDHELTDESPQDFSGPWSHDDSLSHVNYHL